MIIPRVTSCGGYNVFDPFVCQSVHKSCFFVCVFFFFCLVGFFFVFCLFLGVFFWVSTTPLNLLDRISWNFVVMKDILCRRAYSQEILIQFFFWNYAPIELRNLAKIRYTTETVCQRNSSKTAQNILCNFIVDILHVYMCIFREHGSNRLFLSSKMNNFYLHYLWKC